VGALKDPSSGAAGATVAEEPPEPPPPPTPTPTLLPIPAPMLAPMPLRADMVMGLLMARMRRAGIRFFFFFQKSFFEKKECLTVARSALLRAAAPLF
jgi:hypothetical protein